MNVTNTEHADALLAALPAPGQGRLKVFLGAAAGVGKTFAMLQAAQDRQRQGVTVLAAMVVTHGRAETEARLTGLPRLPLRKVQYRDRWLEELDLDALLQARPQLALIDELAHDNVPGSRHGKRWQDVQELLAAGIDVYTTVNVQHLESFNDRVRGITGVQVRETVPDWLVLSASELVLIDLPPHDLLERLREGKVYVPEQARAAIDAFFTPRNLSALRELALQTAAAQVDAGQPVFGAVAGANRLRGRLLVGVDADSDADRLVRHASMVAQRRHLPWSLVHVDTGRLGDETSRQRLSTAQQLAERLGAEVVTLRGADPARTLLEHARERQASLLVVGQSARRRWWCRGVASRLLRLGPVVELSVLERDPALARPKARSVSPARRPAAYLWALGAAGLAGLVASAVPGWLELPNVSLIFLTAVLLVAIRSATGPALVCALASFLLYDLLFIPPHFSLAIQREQDVLTLVFFLVMATLTGQLAGRQRHQVQALRDTQADTTDLLDLSRGLAAASDLEGVVEAARAHLARWPDVSTCVLERTREGRLQAAGTVPATLDATEQAAAQWTWQHGQPAGQGTGTLPGGHWWWWPLVANGRTLGLIGLAPSDQAAVSQQRRQRVMALAQPLAQALARASLAQELEAARLHGETEQLRSALLASVSHDLRTPLTAMRGSIESLQTLGSLLSAADRDTLLESTRLECERLDRYIQNLLDMTRLGHGALTLARDWIAPGELVGAALQRLRSVLAPLVVEVQVPAGLPLLWVHPALIEQALINVLENAARFSPPGGRVQVEAGLEGDRLCLAVIDQGPGIPEAERERIFDMFYTAARGDRGGQGTGLGLAICQGMVGAHGGQVTVSEGDGGLGTRIALCLPLHPPPVAQSEA
jgi:two-component system sensor histidine kinase KdpD